APATSVTATATATCCRFIAPSTVFPLSVRLQRAAMDPRLEIGDREPPVVSDEMRVVLRQHPADTVDSFGARGMHDQDAVPLLGFLDVLPEELALVRCQRGLGPLEQ